MMSCLGEVSAELHKLMLRGGFRYDAEKDRKGRSWEVQYI